ncbi:hypothetical protein GCM10008931_44470 [Oceanobacillus oncorhynchi subsp. oncorhynchi]|uniref:putative PDDEXK endonuclease n=1 Tax=Oceanobacillus oncorhynchi TaxID=545501 RepID=UPI0031D530D5
MTNPRMKGSSYERKIAKILSEWTGETCHRVPQSGAGGVRWGSDSRMNGDIVFPVDSNNSFVYELKKREGWDFKHLLLNTGQIKEWWKQVITDARRMKEHGMSPCLIFSKNRDKDYVIIPYLENIFKHLQAANHPISNQIIWFKDEDGKVNRFNVMLTTLDALTSFINPSYIFDTYKNLDWDKENE